ncbi:MAG: DUF4244 domain-containing protein [Acidimicrobiales bacterium]
MSSVAISKVTAHLSCLTLSAWLATRSAAFELLDLATAVRARRDESGQATAEYALVLLGCAAVALLVGAWATKTGKIGDLLDKVVESVLGKVK